MKKPPIPLEWHPFYREYTELLDWLNQPGGSHVVMVARMEPIRIDATELYPMAPSPEPWVLDKRKAWGPAPYVGRPFVYAWQYATDQLGRAIAGESRIAYRDES